MLIKEIEIHNFKSLKHLSLKNFQKINIFFGENNTGKSNILNALEMVFNPSLKEEEKYYDKKMPIEERFLANLETGKKFFYNTNINEDIKIKVILELTPDEMTICYENLKLAQISDIQEKKDILEFVSELIDKKPLFTIESTIQARDRYCYQFLSLFKINNTTIYDATYVRTGETSYRWEIKGKFKRHDDGKRATQTILSILRGGFICIPTFRKFIEEIEEETPRIEDFDTKSGTDIKKAIFLFYTATDYERRNIFKTLVKTYNNPPFNYGELFVSKDPFSKEIELHIDNGSFSIPISDLGSGAQQALLLLFNIIFYKNKMIGIEEPEANLSPKSQKEFLQKLIEYVKGKASITNQLFISTHSPIFGKRENHYYVSHDGKQTIVESPEIIPKEEFIEKESKHWEALKDAVFEDEYRDRPEYGSLKIEKDNKEN